MTPAEMLQTLARWREAGWLRSLDTAFARFIHETDPGAPASLLLAAALVAQLEGRGHSGLPLAELVDDAAGLLGWPPEGKEAVRQALADGSTDAAGQRRIWQARPVLEIDPRDDTGASPLVLRGGLLYLRRYWRCESRVAAQIHARSVLHAEAGMAAPGLDTVVARELLDKLFGPDPGEDPAAETDWQKLACALALRGRLTIVTGGPGTGKTYTAARLLVLLQALHPGPQPLRVALAAPTGKAAARLRQAIQKALQALRDRLGTAVPIGAWADSLESARTLHALLGIRPGTRRFTHDAANPLEVDVLFVDEASMVHLEMMAALLEALPPGARVILLGDKDQLASVEAGAVMGDLCQPSTHDGAAPGYRPETARWVHTLTGQALPASEIGPGPELAQQTVTLRRSRRFAGPIGQLAMAVNRGDGAAALALLRGGAGGEVALVEAREAAAILPLAVDGRAGAPGGHPGADPGGYRPYLQTLAERPTDTGAFEAWASSVLRRFDRFRVLCAVRDGPWGVAGLSLAIERALADAGLLQRRGDWYEGRPVMVTRNDASLGVFNGDIGVVLRAPGSGESLRSYFLDGDRLRSVSVGRLADVETAFAMTVHKSQGSEFEHVMLVLPDEDVPVLTRELIYTGITRAQSAFTLVASHPGQLVTASSRLTRRVSGLRALLAGQSGRRVS